MTSIDLARPLKIIKSRACLGKIEEISYIPFLGWTLNDKKLGWIQTLFLKILKFGLRNFDCIIRFKIKNDWEIEKRGHVIDEFLVKSIFLKNLSIRWPQFFDFWLIFYSESGSRNSKSKIFRIYRNKVCNQPLVKLSDIEKSSKRSLIIFYHWWNFGHSRKSYLNRANPTYTDRRKWYIFQSNHLKCSINLSSNLKWVSYSGPWW